VIHVATVHWRDPRWIPVQRRYLERHLDGPFRVYADLEEIEPAYAAGFDHVQNLAAGRSFENGIVAHTEKLNALAATILESASDDDLLLFLDGDAFPVAPVVPAVEDILAKSSLVAVRRDENLGDPQPHPSFCVTRVGFWREVGGDWSYGHTWRNSLGNEVTDAGGNLLGTLTRRGDSWQPLLRTNRRNLHSLWFGVYGDLAYHHGAGFRGGLCRRDRAQIGTVPPPPPDLPSDPPPSATERVRWWLAAHKWYLVDKRPVVRRERRALRRNAALSARVFRMLVEDDDFYLRV
jgi:hypothetical protein